MKAHYPRTDFVIVEDYFTPTQAAQWLRLITALGSDKERGFHHPDLKPNRFHKAPKYPVKKFMCLGLYWNPIDYLYYDKIPGRGVRPHAIPSTVLDIAQKILDEFYPSPGFQPQSVMVNFYTQDSSMGLHVDKDEPNKEAPIVGLNFGSTCRFFYEDEKGEMKDLRIPGNSIYVFGKSARLMRHGLGSIYTNTLASGSEEVLRNKERVNLTIRQVLKN
jgi:alkylated DNA repair protein (DNA oxidative demethylase)